jgi:hypothetical protein
MKAVHKRGKNKERTNVAVYREYEIALPDEITHSRKSWSMNWARCWLAASPTSKPCTRRSALEGGPTTHLRLTHSDRMQGGIEQSRDHTFGHRDAQEMRGPA